jgi:hypothetical protein
MNGKGDRRRPSQVSQEEIRKNWERIFGKPEKEKEDNKDKKGAK